ncbi:hypothetical protein REPUB_Repub17cG0039700 [Reevesia pubescens]
MDGIYGYEQNALVPVKNNDGKSSSTVCDYWKDLWSGVAPPKVEVFCWQLMFKRITVKEELAKKTVLFWNAASCLVCSCANESVEHLFFVCYDSWKVWMYFCDLWDVYLVVHINPTIFFKAWQNFVLKGKCNRDWKLPFFAIVWSIWLMRNEVFNKKIFYCDKVIHCINPRITEWFKARWSDSFGSNADVLGLSLLNSVLAKRKKIMEAVWTAPQQGRMKFNVDGSSVGNPGQFGIEGVLRNTKGAIKSLFSKDIGVAYAALAEVMVVKEAFLLYAASKWARTHELVVECDKVNVVKWINSPLVAPWKFRKNMPSIEALKSRILCWQVNHISRCVNGLADKLALAKQIC